MQLPQCVLPQANQKHMGARRPSHPRSHFCVSRSGINSMVSSVLAPAEGRHPACVSHGFPRLLTLWDPHFHPSLLCLKLPAIIPTVTLFATRLPGGMGVCVRRAHQCILSPVSHVVPGTTLRCSRHLERKLGVSLDWKHHLFGCVSEESAKAHVMTLKPSQILTIYLRRVSRTCCAAVLDQNLITVIAITSPFCWLCDQPAWVQRQPMGTRKLLWRLEGAEGIDVGCCIIKSTNNLIIIQRPWTRR